MKSRGLVERNLLLAGRQREGKRRRGRIRIVLLVGTAVFMLWSSPTTAAPSLPMSPLIAIGPITLPLVNNSANGVVFGGQATGTGGFGAIGFASATSSPNFGVAGATNSDTGTGVFGLALATTCPSLASPVGIGQSCVGVVGQSQATFGITAGVLGLTRSPGGAGVRGDATSGVGVLGQTDQGAGIFGRANSAGGFGVLGQTLSSGGAGVLGRSLSTSGAIGVVGQAFSDPSGVGVQGNAFGGVAVDGFVGTGIAVRARVGNAAGKFFSGLDPRGNEKFSVSSSGVITGDGSGLANLPVRYSSFVPTCNLNIPGAISTTATNLGTIGTFIKASGTSSIVLDWGGHVRSGTVSNAVQFFLRVDGNPALGDQASGLLFSQNANQNVFLPMHAVFTGLAAGSHIVQMWVSIGSVYDSASDVHENPGCFNESVTVQEL